MLAAKQASRHHHHHHRSLTSTLIFLLRQCQYKSPLLQIHSKMLVNAIQVHNFLLPRIINLNDYPYASLLFAQILNPDEYAYNVMIRGLTTTWQKYTQSVRLYSQMKVNGLKPDNFTYPFLFISCANLLDLICGKTVHSTVFKTGLDRDDHVAHSLITMYAKCGELVCARKVFDEIRERDLVSWNSMISGYSKAGFAREAVGLFVRMREEGEGFEPSEMTLVSVLGACGDLGDLGLGKCVEGFVVRREMELNSYIGSALVGMYGKCGDLVSARRVFDTMRKKDVVTWNSMITG
ncbi:hypothetical protein Tsubulata_025998 [Turnera subulata]|uniref:Pentacotripeptide-repeat region of PRORP domain-containing protein n=1 Tax=Turnera subulata TaxID=218843 RepID=A0A9Q0J747_9ROSI|nr:hypothetical protein Tsubulata_025998 [Turnera subulata]